MKQSQLKRSLLFIISAIIFSLSSCYAVGINLKSDKIDRIVVKTEEYLRTSTGPSYPRYFADYYYGDFSTKTVVRNKTEIKKICAMMKKFKEVSSSGYVHPQEKKPIKRCDYPYPFNDENVDCFTDNMYISLKMEIYSNNCSEIIVIWGNFSDVCYKNRIFEATEEFQNLIIQYDDKNKEK